MNTIYYILIAWNIGVFALYGLDKWKSMHQKWRIKESALILSAFLMGGAGAMLGMAFFRHKTKHMKFKVLVPIALIINIVIFTGGLYLAKR